MEENAFQIPDSYMVNFGDPQKTNWCHISTEVMELLLENPYEKRKNVAFFHGSSSGKHMNWFGFGNEKLDHEEEDNPHLVEKRHPTKEEVEELIKESPARWIRPYAAIVSHHHPDYLIAGLRDKNPSLGSIRK